MAGTRRFTAPPAVPPGGRLALVAPASPFDPSVLERGRQALMDAGYRVTLAPALSQADRYLAAPDDVRANQFIQALMEPDVHMVLSARGGYGCTRLLPLLKEREEELRALPPRLVCGFSDLTALHGFLQTTLGWRSIHGPVCTSYGSEPAPSRAHLHALMSGTAAGTVLQGRTAQGRGFVCAPLLGGNLAVLAAMCGTPHFPDLDGCILALEDVGERPYRLDRMLTQLCQATQGLKGVLGVALGQFSDCDDTAKGERGVDAVRQVLSGLPVPVVEDLPFGHVSPNLALPLGAVVCLDASNGTLRFLEEAVA